MHEREQDIQKAILDYLRLKHYVCFKHHSTAFTVRDGRNVAFRYGDKGISDIIACSPTGTFVAIEVKTKKGVASDDQTSFIRSVLKNGGIGFFAKSLDDVMAQI